MAYFRKASRMNQHELGRLLGWSNNAVSAAERSWDGKRIREFDADSIAAIAGALGVPVIALFLPPEDAGIAVHYLLDSGDAKVQLNLASLPAVALAEEDSPVTAPYQRRLAMAGAFYREMHAQDFAAYLSAGTAEHRAPIGPLEQMRVELEQRIDDLRAFEREYRSRLIEYLDKQRADLWEGVEDEDPGFSAFHSRRTLGPERP